ncbi:unnamed protein product, partial [Trichobilharzia szidati]
IFPKDQLWVVLESSFCGVPLEDNIPPCPCARVSLLLQVGFSLAVAERELKFEHRDLHWGNVLLNENYIFPLANKSTMSSTLLSSSSSASSSSSRSISLCTSSRNSCKYCSYLDNMDGVEQEEGSDKENKRHVINEEEQEDADDKELHINNNNKYVQFRLNDQAISVPKCGCTVYLIDFTMSRLEQ